MLTGYRPAYLFILCVRGGRGENRQTHDFDKKIRISAKALAMLSVLVQFPVAREWGQKYPLSEILDLPLLCCRQQLS